MTADSQIVMVAEAIIKQAVDDFRDLRRRKAAEIRVSKTDTYSVEELERFFASDWCRLILHGCGIGTTGNRILNHLRAET